MPQHTLIPFLGRTPKGQKEYRTTNYKFDDGSESEPVAFFGWALHARCNPDLLVILGTSGSMWDHLFEGDFDFGADNETERLALVEAVHNKQVSQTLLDPLESPLAHKTGFAIRLQLIPYCRDEAEQAELLRVLASNVNQGDVVDLDITHGMRHQPMLALLSALHLRSLLYVDVQHIWYSAFDPDSQQASVHDLAGLLLIADWLKALAIYDHSGDFSIVGDLIGGEIGDHLKNTAFLESINRVGQARAPGRKALELLLGEASGLSPTAELFSNELQRRLSWVNGNNFHDRQRQLCFEYLEYDRFFEAVVTGWEAITSKLVSQKGLDPNNYKHREEAFEQFRADRNNPRWQYFDAFRRLRNALVHGSQPQGSEIQSAMSDPKRMKKQLVQLLQHLLPRN